MKNKWTVLCKSKPQNISESFSFHKMHSKKFLWLRLKCLSEIPLWNINFAFYQRGFRFYRKTFLHCANEIVKKNFLFILSHFVIATDLHEAESEKLRLQNLLHWSFSCRNDPWRMSAWKIINGNALRVVEWGNQSMYGWGNKIKTFNHSSALFLMDFIEIIWIPLKFKTWKLLKFLKIHFFHLLTFKASIAHKKFSVKIYSKQLFLNFRWSSTRETFNVFCLRRKIFENWFSACRKHQPSQQSRQKLVKKKEKSLWINIWYQHVTK